VNGRGGRLRTFPVAAALPILTALSILAALPASAESPAPAMRYPYVAAFSRQSPDLDRVYFCTGALVAPRWILTAAHCFRTRDGRPIPARDLSAAVGRDVIDWIDPGASVRVERIVAHPDYDSESQANDIALVRLDDIAGPLIAEPDATASADPARATALGFGSFYEGRLAGRAINARGSPAAQMGGHLRRVDVDLVEVESCAARADIGADWGGPARICGAAAPEDACTGDSGGPLIAEAAEGPDRLLGIVSFGSGCGVAVPVVIYTRVGAYSDWIAATIAGD
jgi:secreted trypsin-like serine protease